MSEEVNKEQTKAAKQENITEISDDKLDEAAGGAALTGTTGETRINTLNTPPELDLVILDDDVARIRDLVFQGPE